MRQQYLATVRPNIDTAINTQYAQHDLLFDWHRFEIPPGEACIKSFNIIMPGTNGSAGNAVDFTFFIARSVFGAAPPSLGTVNAAVNNAAGKIAFTGSRNHIVYTQTVDASVMQSPSTYTQSYNIYTSTKMNTAGGSQAAQFENALQPGGVNIGNSKYTGNYNDSTSQPGMNSFWIAAITNGTHDFGTGVLLNQESGQSVSAAVDPKSGSSNAGAVSLTVDGTDADDVFSVGDDLIADDGAIIGTVLEITSNTIVVVNEVQAALENNDEICVRNPIIFNLGIEY